MPAGSDLMRVAGKRLLCRLCRCRTMLLAALLLAALPCMAQAQQGQSATVRAQILQQFGGEFRDPRVTGFIQGIGQRLGRAAGYPVRFTVLDTDAVNAFTTGSDEVYLTRGLLAIANSEAEIAGVMGHELGHVLGRHAQQRRERAEQAKVVSVLAGAPGGAGRDIAGNAQQHLAEFSQAQEFAADESAVALLRRAGYAPLAMAQFLETLRDQSDLEARLAGHSGNERLNILSTHPLTRDRIAHAAELAGGRAGEAGDLDRDAYWRAVDGLVYGDSAAQGFVRSDRFVHPDLDFQFQVPPGFVLRNSPSRVTAQRGDGAAIEFTSDGTRGARSMRQYLSAWLDGASFRELNEFSLNGRPAISGMTVADSDRGRVEVRVLAVRWTSQNIFRFLFVFPGDATPQLEAAYRDVADGLQGAGRVQIRPLHIRVITAGPTDTVRSLAAAMPFEELREERLRVLNGFPVDWEIRPGARVKIVE